MLSKNICLEFKHVKFVVKNNNFPSLTTITLCAKFQIHDDVIKWKHFPRYWPFVRGIHRSPVNSPHKGQWRRALMFSLICINDWVNNREAGDLRRCCAHYDVIVVNFITPNTDSAYTHEDGQMDRQYCGYFAFNFATHIATKFCEFYKEFLSIVKRNCTTSILYYRICMATKNVI